MAGSSSSASCRPHALNLTSGTAADAMETEEDASAATAAESGGGEKREEPSSHMLDNPARVVPAQEKLVSFTDGSRWVPVRGAAQPTSGIIVLRDTRPGMCQVPTGFSAIGGCSNTVQGIKASVYFKFAARMLDC